MRSFINLFFFLLMHSAVFSQNVCFYIPTREQYDSAQWLLKNTTNDTLKMAAYRDLGFYNQHRKTDSARYYLTKELELAQKLKLKFWESYALGGLCEVSLEANNFSELYKFILKALLIIEDPVYEQNIWQLSRFSQELDPHKARLYLLANDYNFLGIVYDAFGQSDKALSNYLRALKIGESINDKVGLSFYNLSLSGFYQGSNQLDMALGYSKKALVYANMPGYRYYIGGMNNDVAKIYLKMGLTDSARKYINEEIHVNLNENTQIDIPYSYLSLANLFKYERKYDSAVFYARSALLKFTVLGDSAGINAAYSSLSDNFQSLKIKDSAFKYLKISKEFSDVLSRLNIRKQIQYQSLDLDEQLRLQNVEKEKIQLQNNIRTYIMLSGTAVFMVIAFILYRNNRQRKKANELLQKQKEEIAEQKDNVEQTLVELRSTQSQLIQSEKMASLGELTAGIAHEIQNPLNFVNNFSEVSSELMAEMNDELNKGAIEEAKAIAIAIDILQNLEKINHHGKRADAIVKGMLQHSQTSTGKKEPTDINKLADEYLRLAYHGLRAKDKSFNATLNTDFDETIGRINIIPQDIGRVILNVITNAFYAVNEKKKLHVDGFESRVSLTTKKIGDTIEIRIGDNGNGIPKKLVDKIFQPFFTTKPTGQGTGLGLSLAYDIVKAHGGELNVQTKEGEGSEFIIQIPAI